MTLETSASASFRPSQTSAVRRSCQTMAGWIGRPLDLSQTTTVSRWLVIPMAATSASSRPEVSTASRNTSTQAAKISSASCSTQPLAG